MYTNILFYWYHSKGCIGEGGHSASGRLVSIKSNIWRLVKLIDQPISIDSPDATTNCWRSFLERRRRIWGCLIEVWTTKKQYGVRSDITLQWWPKSQRNTINKIKYRTSILRTIQLSHPTLFLDSTISTSLKLLN